MTLLKIAQFGGIIPKVEDPIFLPEGKSQDAENVRFDQGGLVPLKDDKAVLEGITSETAIISLFLYHNEGNKYFFAWTTDVNAIKTPIASDSYNRVYFTESGALKVTDKDNFDYYAPGASGLLYNVPLGLFYSNTPIYPYTSLKPSAPAPVNAATISGTPSGDPSLRETRAYVYTFVNSYGEEGPPSPASNLLSINDGDAVSVTGMDGDPGGSYDITYKRIYRLNQGETGAEYQYVTEIAVATTTYSDTVLSAALGEVLATTEWDEAPSGISGIIALPNGVLAGFVDNLLCLTVPNYPHAWPVSYQKPAEFDIVGLGAFGTTVVVLTEGQPYIVVGDDPANTVMERVNPGLSCVSKPSIVQAGEVVLYASPEGISAIGPNISEVITLGVLTPEQWMSDYNPTTMKGFYWQGKYVGFYTTTAGVQKGFMFDLKTADLTDLDFYATAGYFDKNDGTLYLVIGDDILIFNGETTYRDMDVLTKIYRFQTTNFGVIQVWAPSYPDAGGEGITIDVRYPDLGVTDSFGIWDREPLRLTPVGMVEACEVRIQANLPVSAIFLATTPEELP